MSDLIDQLVRAIADASVGGLEVFAEDAVLDATVPNWRFTVRGGDEGGRIAADRVWCGGRWPASLLAEMEAAARARG